MYKEKVQDNMHVYTFDLLKKKLKEKGKNLQCNHLFNQIKRNNVKEANFYSEHSACESFSCLVF